jgi:hypothetical protein
MMYIFAFLICGCVAALVAAHWVSNLTDLGPNTFWRRVWIAFAFYIGLKLLLSIPLFGWILFPIVVLTAFGALITSIKWKKTARSNPFSIAQRPMQAL